MPDIKNFDFLAGHWKVANRMLAKRFSDCSDWIEFELDYEYIPMLGGRANVDRMFGEIDNDYFEGMSVRTHNADTDEWTIYWADTSNTDLMENTRGRFIDGVGVFYGMEPINGVRHRLRFIWSSIDATHARWEQAHLDPKTDQWETNWIMDFRRVADR